MVATRGQTSRIDGTEASVTASGTRVPRNNTRHNVTPPRRDEETPNFQQVLEQMQAVQARLARTEQELWNVRAERDVLLDKSERSGDSRRSNSRSSRRTRESSPARSHTTPTHWSGSIPRNDRHNGGDRGEYVFKFKTFLDCKPTHELESYENKQESSHEYDDCYVNSNVGYLLDLSFLSNKASLSACTFNSSCSVRAKRA